ncbi:MAG: anti-sigma factor family protein [Chloroflexota bacterium]
MNRRDLELLSAYLDGELKPADSARLEARLNADPELASVLNDLRAARTLLRKLPSRKAPRNFTLTRKMVGQNPPLPRAYPAFRLATVLATLLFFFSFGVNFVGTQLASPANFGMGGGGAESFAVEEAAPQAAAPAEEPPLSLAPAQPTEDALRVMETPAAKSGGETPAPAQDQPPAVVEPLPEPQRQAPLVPSAWQIGLAGVAAVSALLMGAMRQLAARRWK